MEITREKARVLHQEIMEAVRAVAAKHGMTTRFGNATYETTTFRIKAELLAVAEDGENLAAKAEWMRHAEWIGMMPSDFGRTFISRGQRYKIVGIKPRSRTMPIIAEREDGKRFKFAPESINLLLGRGLTGKLNIE